MNAVIMLEAFGQPAVRVLGDFALHCAAGDLHIWPTPWPEGDDRCVCGLMTWASAVPPESRKDSA